MIKSCFVSSAIPKQPATFQKGMMSARSVDAKVPKGKPAGKGAKPPGRPSQTPVVPAPTGPGQRMTREAVVRLCGQNVNGLRSRGESLPWAVWPQEKLIETNGSTEYSLELQGQSFNTIEGLESVGDGCVLPFGPTFCCCFRDKTRFLRQYSKLRCLDLSWNALEAIHGLDALKQLRELKLYRNRLTSCDGLKE
jgi:hypothetical protein